jgi:hypothetical protein
MKNTGGYAHFPYWVWDRKCLLLFPPEITIIVIRFLNLGSTSTGASINTIYIDETMVHRANARDYSTDRLMKKPRLHDEYRTSTPPNTDGRIHRSFTTPYKFPS